MLKWCSYCQSFICEIPPYDVFSVTHGICAACGPSVLESTDADLVHAKFLQTIQENLFEAGERGDVKAAESVIEAAVKAEVKPVDILVGMVAPMLYQVGEDWKEGRRSVADEHRFTAFCETMYERIAASTEGVIPADSARGASPEVLLMNAPGNHHTLGIRVLGLWMVRDGRRVQVIETPPSLEDLVAHLSAVKPQLLMISIALAEQYMDVKSIVECISELPPSVRPRVVVGGNAVKLGLVPEIPGAELTTDISDVKVNGTGLTLSQVR